MAIKMQTKTSHNEEPEDVGIPLEVQIRFSELLYKEWQQSTIKRLDKYLTFPEWLMTVSPKPYQADESDFDFVDEDPIRETMSFAGLKWRKEWGFGLVLITSSDTALNLRLGFFYLIWKCGNSD